MIKKELKEKIKKMLEGMAYKNIEFSNDQKGRTTVKFDSDSLLSFTPDLGEWKYTGIQLNDEGPRKYKIEFVKTKKSN